MRYIAMQLKNLFALPRPAYSMLLSLMNIERLADHLLLLLLQSTLRDGFYAVSGRITVERSNIYVRSECIYTFPHLKGTWPVFYGPLNGSPCGGLAANRHAAGTAHAERRRY